MGARWGYTDCGRARVFEDGVLPEGWSEKPTFQLTAEEWTKRHAAEMRGDVPPAIVPIAEPKRRGRPPKVKHADENPR